MCLSILPDTASRRLLATVFHLLIHLNQNLGRTSQSPTGRFSRVHRRGRAVVSRHVKRPATAPAAKSARSNGSLSVSLGMSLDIGKPACTGCRCYRVKSGARALPRASPVTSCASGKSHRWVWRRRACPTPDIPANRHDRIGRPCRAGHARSFADPGSWPELPGPGSGSARGSRRR